MSTPRLAPILLACFAPLALPAGADAKPGDPRLQQLKSVLESRFPDSKIQSISPSPVAGLYEVISANLIVYADISGDYVVMGPMISARTRSNITEERLGEINRVDFSALPLERAMKSVKGDGSRRLAVFADPLCPYCQELEKTLEGITDVTIYTFLIPLEDLHPGATQKSREIWCSPDPAASWAAWMLHDTAPQPKAGCEATPVTENLKLARTLRINSTPTLVFGSGVRMAGALPAARLQRLLDGIPASAPGDVSPSR
jgi:thiol:disulfide interchange protein DsbC